MKNKLFLLLCLFAFILTFAGCKETPTETPNKTVEQTPTEETPTIPTVTPTVPTEGNKDEYVETNLDDGKRRAPYTLKIYSENENIIYFGERFTGEGYVVKFVYEEYENMGTTLPPFSAVTLTKFSFDDSKVDYRKEGRYVVKITGRVRSDVLSVNIIVTVKADKYEYLGVKHLMGLSCDEYVNFALGGDVASIKPSNLYAIYTENQYENDELVKISEEISSGYELDTTSVDVSKAGQYPVYVTLSETYDSVTITVRTFFILVVA